MFVWGVMSLAALGTLVWRHPLADVAAKAAAPIGAAFTLMCLITGSLWGRPMWGTYWVWDARLTSVLVLFLMYLGLIVLWRTIDDPGRAARAAAVLTLVGAINVPIIKFSRLVEYAAPAGLGDPPRRLSDRCLDPDPAADQCASVHAFVSNAPPRRHAKRDHAPPGANLDDAAGRCRRTLNP